MEKGLEISFQVPDSNAATIVEALANMVGNEFSKDFEIQWRIFDVTLDRQKFYKVCFTGKKLTRLHPHNEQKIKERFDELAHYDKEKLFEEYGHQKKKGDFKVQGIKEKTEEYDLWQDRFWDYF